MRSKQSLSARYRIVRGAIICLLMISSGGAGLAGPRKPPDLSPPGSKIDPAKPEIKPRPPKPVQPDVHPAPNGGVQNPSSPKASPQSDFAAPDNYRGAGAKAGRVVAPATVKPSNLTPRGTLTNLKPGDPVRLENPMRTLKRDTNGRYWLSGPNGSQYTPSGSYDYVAMPNTELRIARSNQNPDYSTHLGLSGGGEVMYAGSVRFANSTGPNRGAIISWDNASGHYQPPPELAKQAGLPMDRFNAVGKE
jgi:hypothetical protein